MESTLSPRRPKSLLDRWLSLPLWVHLASVAVSFGLQQAVQAVLNSFYERSGYPVPYFVGQLSFSAQKLEGWYSVMSEAGTLEVYWQTQFVDFAFVVTTALLHFTALALVVRLLPAGSVPRKIGVVMIVVGLAAPAMDVLENLVSFINLADPGDISEPLAIAYSLFAALKFVGFALTYAWFVIGLVWAAAIALRNRSRS